MRFTGSGSGKSPKKLSDCLTVLSDCVRKPINFDRLPRPRPRPAPAQERDWLIEELGIGSHGSEHGIRCFFSRLFSVFLGEKGSCLIRSSTLSVTVICRNLGRWPYTIGCKAQSSLFCIGPVLEYTRVSACALRCTPVYVHPCVPLCTPVYPRVPLCVVPLCTVPLCTVPLRTVPHVYPLCTRVYPLCTHVYACVPLCSPVHPCVPPCTPRTPLYICVPLCVHVCTPVCVLYSTYSSRYRYEHRSI